MGYDGGVLMVLHGGASPVIFVGLKSIDHRSTMEHYLVAINGVHSTWYDL